MRVEVYSGQSGLLVDTIPHEVVHVLQRRGFVGFRAGHWLDEGLATTYESEGSRDRRREPGGTSSCALRG